MKLKDANGSHTRRDAKQKTPPQTKQATKNCDLDVIKAGNHVLGVLAGDQADYVGIVQPQVHALPELGAMQPDPLLLVALHASRPRLLSLDDLLACRCVCKQWRQRLSTAFCHTIRIPHSLWSEAANARFAACISSAAGAYSHTTDLLLDAGGCRPGLPPVVWQPLLTSIHPWLEPEQQQQRQCCKAAASTGTNCNSGSRSGAASKCIHLHLRAPPSPQRLLALSQLPLLSHLQLQHTSQSLYSRHLAALASMSDLQSLVLVLTHPRLDLRSLAHQRVRRVPLKMDCLSTLQHLTQLELVSRGPAGEILPDTVATFSSAASLAALSKLKCLAISEAALPGPTPANEWLQPLTALQQLQLVQLDELGKGQGRKGRAAAAAGSGSTCGTASAAAAAAGAAAGTSGSNAGGLASGLLCAGGFGALAAAAAAAGRGGMGTAEQLQVLQQQQQQLQALLPGLQGQLQAHHGAGGRLSSSSSTGSSGAAAVATGGQPTAPSAAAAATGSSNSSSQQHLHPPSQPPTRTSSVGSSCDTDSLAAGATADPPSLPPLDLSTLQGLNSLLVANLAGERLVGLKIPCQLTKLALHLANPCPGAVTGEQLVSVVLQSAQTLVSLELGLGMRFSLSGGVMRGLKRGLKGLKDLTLVEGTQDHLEGLGCWCNLRRLELVEGRCSVPLRGLYELSMRAAMGRTPGVLRYCGHVRHVEELAGRLGAVLQELRLDSLTGLCALSRSTLMTADGSGSEQPDDSSSSSSSNSSPSSSSRLQQQEDEEAAPVPPLAQLVSLTRLEILGERLGVLDSSSAAALASLKQLIVLQIEGQEAWLAPELGVKEQLGWLRSLTRLRQLRLSGVMIGRSRLAGSSSGGISSSSTGTATGVCEKPSSSSSSGGGKLGGGKLSGTAAPTVKGLGNGLAFSSSGSTAGVSSSGTSKGCAAAPAGAAATAAVAAAAAGVIVDPAAAAARDMLVAISLEELRRWLCQLLPHCRVWLD